MNSNPNDMTGYPTLDQVQVLTAFGDAPDSIVRGIIKTACELDRKNRAQSMPAGGAWYPSVGDVRSRVRETISPEMKESGSTDDIDRAYIRAAIDLYRERGGEVTSQPAVAGETFEPDEAITDKWESGELGRSMEHAERAAVAGEARVVAWRYVSKNGMTYRLNEGAPPESAYDCGTDTVQCLYDRPPSPTVPDDVMAAADRVRRLLSSLWIGQRIHVERGDATAIVTFLESIHPTHNADGVLVPRDLLSDLRDLASDAVIHHHGAMAGHEPEVHAENDRVIEQADAILSNESGIDRAETKP